MQHNLQFQTPTALHPKSISLVVVVSAALFLSSSFVLLKRKGRRKAVFFSGSPHSLVIRRLNSFTAARAEVPTAGSLCAASIIRQQPQKAASDDSSSDAEFISSARNLDV
jgi:hypothetical protein